MNKTSKEKNKHNVGKESADIVDTISGRTDKPKLHFNSKPHEIIAVKECIRDYLQESACQIVSLEFSSDTAWINRDKNRWSRADEEEENGPCPQAGAGKKDWEDSYNTNAKSFKKDREDFIADSKKGIGYIHNNHIVLELKNELMQIPEYVVQLNKKSNSIVTYWNRLMGFLAGKISYLKKTSVSNAIRLSIKELRVRDCAMEYYHDITKLLMQLETKMIEENVADTVANMNEEMNEMNEEEVANAIRLININEIAKVKKKIDEDTELIREIYDRLYRFGMDDMGTSKFDQIKASMDCPIGETPYDNRVVETIIENGVQVRKVTGGLKNMLSEFKRSLDRIKNENPTKKIFYARIKPNIGIDLKTGDQKRISVNVETSKRKAESVGGGPLKLPRYDDDIFKNKDKAKAPCYYCRDQLIKYQACKTHAWKDCKYNIKGSNKSKFTKEEVDKFWKDAQPLRDLAKQKGLGRQRGRENANISSTTVEEAVEGEEEDE